MKISWLINMALAPTLPIDPSYSLNKVCPKFFFFFFAMNQFEWPINKLKKTMGASKNKRFYFEV